MSHKLRDFMAEVNLVYRQIAVEMAEQGYWHQHSGIMNIPSQLYKKMLERVGECGHSIELKELEKYREYISSGKGDISSLYEEIQHNIGETDSEMLHIFELYDEISFVGNENVYIFSACLFCEGNYLQYMWKKRISNCEVLQSISGQEIWSREYGLTIVYLLLYESDEMLKIVKDRENCYQDCWSKAPEEAQMRKGEVEWELLKTYMGILKDCSERFRGQKSIKFQVLKLDAELLQKMKNRRGE